MDEERKFRKKISKKILTPVFRSENYQNKLLKQNYEIENFAIIARF